MSSVHRVPFYRDVSWYASFVGAVLTLSAVYAVIGPMDFAPTLAIAAGAGVVSGLSWKYLIPLPNAI